MNKIALNLTSVTSIDMGLIDPDGKLTGRSFKPVITVHGNLQGDEQVIEDFSSIKRRIKAAIDDKLSGYDHKLIYDPSQCKLTPGFYPGTATLTVGDGKLQVTGDPRSFRKLAYTSFRSTALTVDQILSRELERFLNVTFPGLRFEVMADVRAESLMPYMASSFGVPLTQPIYFSYVHGLPKSTSWGCQFIAHGHLSFIQLLSNSSYYCGADSWQNFDYLDLNHRCYKVAVDIASTLDGAYIVNKEYHSPIGQIGEYVRYTSKDRGTFELQMQAGSMPIIQLDTETTVENIAQYVATRWKDKLLESSITSIYVSEGLQKGALARV